MILLKYIPRDELIDIIVRNNMVEEFMAWVKNIKEDISEPISLRDIDYELLLKFVLDRKLIELGDELEFIRDIEIEKSFDDKFVNVEKQTLPKKIRRKT